MGSFRLRQGPQLRLPGISWRATLLGVVLGVALFGAVPSVASGDADLSVTATATPEPVLRGQVLTYRITVHNPAGANPAPQVSVDDQLPQGLTIIPETLPSNCSMPDPGLLLVVCNLGTVDPGTDVSVEFGVTVRPEAFDTFTSTATVASPEPDPDPNNNSVDVTSTVAPSADLGLSVTAVPDPATAGELLVYSIVVHNKGPSPATGVTVIDTLPSGVSLVEPGPDCAESAPGTVTCGAGDIAVAREKSFAITVRTGSAGTVTNQVRVESGTHEPHPDDNSVSLDTTVVPPPAPVISGQTGGGQKTGPLEVVLTGSYVLISGRSVKLVKGRYVPVSLTCAGQRKCEGTITVSTANPVRTAKKPRKGKRPKKRIARLGSKKFSIEGNRRRKVLVPLSKSKVRLLRRLKRVKAKAAIREIDVKGNPRISTRTFILRAR